MLINIMYHHIGSDALSNSPQIFEEHLKYIKAHFTSVFPSNDKLPKNPICLIFDDGYFDFYHYAFPLLKKYEIKALLAVPSKYILKTCQTQPKIRLSFKHDDCYKNYESGTFCSFEELKEMQSSGLVKIASHSHSHCDLTDNTCDLEKELKLSKEILEKNLGGKIENFVYPYGKYNNEILKKTLEIYDFAFRIGKGIHKDFSGIRAVNYRIKGDNLKSADEIFSRKNMIKYYLKASFKRIIDDK